MKQHHVGVRQARWIVPLGLLIVVSAFWLPSRFKTTDTVEGWWFLNVAEEPGWTVGPSGRIMEALSWEAAALLSPDTFVGAQLVLAAFFFGKAYLLYRILRELRLVASAPAFVIALLFVIYPADEGLFELRGLTRHATVFFYLLATWLMLLACRRRTPLFLPLMFVSLIVSCLTDEAGLLLAFTTPLLLLLVPDCPRRFRQQVAGIWYLGILVSVVLVFSSGARYQATRLRGGLRAASFARSVVTSTVSAYEHGLVLAWQETIDGFDRSAQYLPLAGSIALLVAGCTAWLGRADAAGDSPVEPSARQLALLALAGLVVLGLGFLPYSVTDMRWVHRRVYFFPSLGAALVWGVAILFAVRRLPAYRWAALALISAALTFLAAANGLRWAEVISRESARQQRALASLAEQAPHLQPGTVLVLYRRSEGDQPFVEDWIAGAAVDWMYDTLATRTILCSGALQDCTFSSAGITIPRGRRFVQDARREFPYKEIMVFQYFPARGYVLLDALTAELVPTGQPTGYAPFNRVAAYTPFPHRPLVAFESEFAPSPAGVAPKRWKGEGATMDDRRVCDIAQQGHCSLHLTQAPALHKRFSQSVPLPGGSGDRLTLKLWARMSANPEDSGTPQIVLQLHHANGTTVEEALPLDALSETWTGHQVDISALAPFTQVILRLESGTGGSEVWFDNLSLTAGGQTIFLENPSFEQ